MEIPNKRTLQQIAFNHSSDIELQDLYITYIWLIHSAFIKKHTAKPCFFKVIDATLDSDNSLLLRKNLLERI